MSNTLTRSKGNLLRAIRTEQGKTLREVSTASFISLGHMSEAETGQKQVSDDLLSPWLEALNITPSEFFRELAREME